MANDEPRLAARPNGFDEPDGWRDYTIWTEDGRKIGRIYSHCGPLADLWTYAIYGWGSGLASDHDEAMEKVKAQWLRMQKP